MTTTMTTRGQDYEHNLHHMDAALHPTKERSVSFMALSAPRSPSGRRNGWNPEVARQQQHLADQSKRQWQPKMEALMKDPAMFQEFKELAVRSRIFSATGVCAMLHEYLDQPALDHEAAGLHHRASSSPIHNKIICQHEVVLSSADTTCVIPVVNA